MFTYTATTTHHEYCSSACTTSMVLPIDHVPPVCPSSLENPGYTIDDRACVMFPYLLISSRMVTEMKTKVKNQEASMRYGNEKKKLFANKNLSAEFSSIIM